MACRALSGSFAELIPGKCEVAMEGKMCDC